MSNNIDLKKKIAQDFKDVSVDANNNPDFAEIMNSIIKDPSKLLFLEDSINFDNSICLSVCKGDCCIGEKIIRLTIPDIAHIIHSEALKQILNQQERLSLLQNFQFFLGGSSLIPMAIIKFNSENTCPFLTLELKLNKNDKNRINFASVGGRCVIGQKDKPIPCMLFPLGRISFKSVNEIGEKEYPDYIFTCADCPATKTTNKVDINKFVGSLKERTEENEEYMMSLYAIIQKMKKKVGEERTKAIIAHVANLMISNIGNWRAILRSQCEQLENWMQTSDIT